MLSLKMRNLAAMLLQRPELAASVAAYLDELADCASHLERASIAPQLMAPGVLPISGENVVRIPIRAGR